MIRSSPRLARVLGAWAALAATCGVTAALAHDGGDRVTPARLTAAVAATGTDGADVARPRPFDATSPPAPSPATTAAAPAATDTSAPPQESGPLSAEPTDDTGEPAGEDTPAPAPPDTAPPVAAVVQPVAGAYPVVITGTASLNGEPQAVPVTGDLVVEQLGGTDQRVSMPSGPATIVTTLRWSATGADLLSLALSAGGIDKTFLASAPVPFLPSGAPVGYGWQWQLTSTDGDTTLAIAGSVTGTATMVVAGQQLPVVLVDNSFTITGDVSGTGHIGTAVSDELRLPVVQQQTIDATARLFLFSARLVSDTTMAATQLSPR